MSIRMKRQHGKTLGAGAGKRPASPGAVHGFGTGKLPARDELQRGYRVYKAGVRPEPVDWFYPGNPPRKRKVYEV